MIVLLCQGMVFETGETSGSTIFAIFVIVIITGCLLLTSLSALKRALWPHRGHILIPKPTFRFLCAPIVHEILQINSDTQMRREGQLEIKAEDFLHDLTPRALEEVLEINGNYGILDNESFEIAAIQSRSQPQHETFRSAEVRQMRSDFDFAIHRISRKFSKNFSRS